MELSIKSARKFKHLPADAATECATENGGSNLWPLTFHARLTETSPSLGSDNPLGKAFSTISVENTSSDVEEHGERAGDSRASLFLSLFLFAAAVTLLSATFVTRSGLRETWFYWYGEAVSDDNTAYLSILLCWGISSSTDWLYFRKTYSTKP